MEALHPYSPAVEEKMVWLYNNLNEKDRRLYASVEAAKLGYGGQAYVSQLFGCDTKTIERGSDELAHPEQLPVGRIRKKGGT